MSKSTKLYTSSTSSTVLDFLIAEAQANECETMELYR